MKISDKLSKVDRRFSVEICDNGFIIEISGRDDNDDYGHARIMCHDEQDMLTLVEEALNMEIDD